MRAFACIAAVLLAATLAAAQHTAQVGLAACLTLLFAAYKLP